MNEGESQAATRFELRLEALESDLSALGGDRILRDVLLSAKRAQDVLNETRTLLDSNINVLFGDESAETRHQLQGFIEHATEQLRRALSEEYEVEPIRHRVTMAVSMTDLVVRRMSDKVAELRSKQLL